MPPKAFSTPSTERMDFWDDSTVHPRTRFFSLRIPSGLWRMSKISKTPMIMMRMYKIVSLTMNPKAARTTSPPGTARKPKRIARTPRTVTPTGRLGVMDGVLFGKEGGPGGRDSLEDDALTARAGRKVGLTQRKYTKREIGSTIR